MKRQIKLTIILCAAIALIAFIVMMIHPGRYLLDRSAYWGSMNGVFWDELMLVLIFAALLTIAILLFKNIKKLSIRIPAAILGVIFAVITGFCLIMLFLYHKDMTKKVMAVSPDGQHELIDDGTDTDVYGNTSGYGYYALSANDGSNVYYRVFRTLDASFTPEIKWYDDGFWVSFYCKEDTDRKPGEVSVRSENSKVCFFTFKEVDEGYYFYY